MRHSSKHKTLADSRGSETHRKKLHNGRLNEKKKKEKNKADFNG